MFILYFLMMMVPIVIIHELGHFYIGKYCGIKPEVFSVGFGPEIWRRKDKDGVIWRFAAIPLGGYVKFANDKNGTSFPNLDTTKPTYLATFGAKLATLLAGPFSNFILSLLIFFIYAFGYGGTSDGLVMERVHAPQSLIERGDKILSVEGQEVSTMEEFVMATTDSKRGIQAVIERAGTRINIEIWNPNAPIITGIDPKLPAFKAGILPGDLIERINGTYIETSSQLAQAVEKAGASPINILLLRDDLAREIQVTPEIVTDPNTQVSKPRIGVSFGGIYETVHERLGFVDSMKFAVDWTFWIITSSFEGIRDLITGKVGLDAMSGPVGIGKMAEQSASFGAWNFIFTMGIMSSAIGFMNLLPLPVLDGGHVVLITFEKIIGKLPPQKLINVIFTLGFGLLLGLMLFTTSRELFG